MKRAVDSCRKSTTNLKCDKKCPSIKDKIQLLSRSDDASDGKDARNVSFSVHVGRYLPFVGG